MSIGLLVDFNMHILLRYYESPCTSRESKVKDALQTMGSSVVVGGLSTFLGVVPLLFSSSSLMKNLFYGFWGMVLVGCGHGVIVMPVLLSYIGPVETFAFGSATSKAESSTRSIEEDSKRPAPLKHMPVSIGATVQTSDCSSARQRQDSEDNISVSPSPSSDSSPPSLDNDDATAAGKDEESPLIPIEEQHDQPLQEETRS